MKERILDMFIYHLYTSSKRSYLIKESYFILNIIFTNETTNYTQVLLHLLQSNKMYIEISDLTLVVMFPSVTVGISRFHILIFVNAQNSFIYIVIFGLVRRGHKISIS